jgi:hypothetical protein
MTTLQEAIQAIEPLKVKIGSGHHKNIADKLLGQYKGILPENKTSTQFIHEMRNSLYGKVQAL